MKNLVPFLFLLTSIRCGGLDDSSNGEKISAFTPTKKNPKVFSIFSVVQFQNKGCRSTMILGTSGTTNGYRNGTCLTSVECSNKGGSSSGECAGGFGVCCVFMLSTCGGSVDQNCSYIKNPNYPSQYGSTTACSYTIKKCDPSVCQFRLDFENFLINGPADTSETGGGACQDSLTTTTSTSLPVPKICGSNVGHHMYLDAGTGSSDTATLAFAFTSQTGGNPNSLNTRFWDIKVTQIPCNAAYRAPEGCLQYHTGKEGRFTSFNYQGEQSTKRMHLASQNQRICIRQEEGYCCVVYSECAGETEAFRINTSGTDFKTPSPADIGSNCSEDFVVIDGSSSTGGGSLQNRYCGGFLTDGQGAAASNPIRDCTPPFEVSIVTDATTDGTAATVANMNRGICLDYHQEPCGNIVIP